MPVKLNFKIGLTQDQTQIFKFNKNGLLTNLIKNTTKSVLFFDKLHYIHDYKKVLICKFITS